MKYEFAIVGEFTRESTLAKLNELGRQGFHFVAIIPVDDPGYDPDILMQREIPDPKPVEPMPEWVTCTDHVWSTDKTVVQCVKCGKLKPPVITGTWVVNEHKPNEGE